MDDFLLAGNRLFAPAPDAVIHVIEPLDGGLSEMEKRVLTELAASAGARRQFWAEGRELADPEVRAVIAGTP